MQRTLNVQYDFMSLGLKLKNIRAFALNLQKETKTKDRRHLI